MKLPRAWHRHHATAGTTVTKPNEPIVSERLICRANVAQKYLRGRGLEIGAAHLPLKLPRGTTVKYVDRVPLEELKRIWPEVANLPALVNIDIVDDGETLATIEPNSQDFIVGNHFLEHCLDPIGTIIHLQSKLRDRGILFFAIPEKRHTFDRVRPVTPYEHLLDEYWDGGKQSFRAEQTREVALLREKEAGDVDRRVQALLNSGCRVHYHVWTYAEILELFTRTIRDFKLELEPECFTVNGSEVIAVLRKTAPPN
jgi:hypothetical protein